MPSYRVYGLNEAGKKFREVLTADSEQQLINMVRQRGAFLESYKVIQSKEGIALRKLDNKALTVFCYQMSTMVKSGIDIIDALQMIQSKARNKTERSVYRNLYETVQKGNPLSTAMEVSPVTLIPCLSVW